MHNPRQPVGTTGECLFVNAPVATTILAGFLPVPGRSGRRGYCEPFVILRRLACCPDNFKEGVIKPDLYEPELNVVYADLMALRGRPGAGA